MTSKEGLEVMRSRPWVTATIKGGGQTTVGSCVESVEDEVFMVDVLFSFLDLEITSDGYVACY